MTMQKLRNKKIFLCSNRRELTVHTGQRSKRDVRRDRGNRYRGHPPWMHAGQRCRGEVEKLLEFGLGSSVKSSRVDMKTRSSYGSVRCELFFDFGHSGRSLVSFFPQHTKHIICSGACLLVAAAQPRACPSPCEGCLVPSF